MPSHLCHFEFMTSDPEKCKAFYGAVFDWQFDDESMPGYTLVQTGQEPSGGVFPKPASAPQPCLNVYFQVDDIDQTMERATANGATELVAKTPIPGVGHFAMFVDPEGVVVGVMQPEA